MIWTILLISFVLRLFVLDQSLWLDEATSGLVARDIGFIEILTEFSPGDFHPPFYYLFLKAWAFIFGATEIALRLFSVTAGVLTVYFVYLIGKEIKNSETGLLAAIFIATSGLHIYYSQEARMYALSAFLVTTLVYLFIKLKKSKGIWLWFVFSFLLVVNSFTDYLPNTILIVFWSFSLWVGKSREWWKKFILSHIPLVFFWLFWFPTFSKQLSSGLGVKTSAPGWWKVLGGTNLKQLALVPVKFVLGRISLLNKKLYAVLSGTAVTFYGLVMFFPILKRGFKKLLKQKKEILIWMWLIIPILTSALLGLKLSVFSYFRLLFVLPAFYLLLSFGVSRFKPKLKIVVVFVILGLNLLSSSAYFLNERFQREDWRSMVETVEENSVDNSVVLFVTNGQMEGYRYYSKSDKLKGPDGLSNEYSQIWLMRYVQPIFDPDDSLRERVEKLDYSKVKEYNFNGVVVWEYKK